MRTASAFAATAIPAHLSSENSYLLTHTNRQSYLQLPSADPKASRLKFKNIHLPEEQEIRKTANASLVAAPIFQRC